MKFASPAPKCEDAPMSPLTNIVRWLYSLLFVLLLPLVFLRLLWCSRKNPDYRQRWAERLGIFKSPPKTGGLWIHAVSVGESIAAISIIKAFQQEFPNVPVVVTATTPTGSKQIQTQLKDSVFHVYFPYDLPWAFASFLKRIRPRLCVIMETELWPNCLQVCKKQNLPVIVANARLSLHSMIGYRRIQAITREMLLSLTCVAAQSQADGERFVSLGLPRERLQVIGNVKYDLTLPAGIEDQAQRLRNHWGAQRLVLIAASTHAQEEEQILKAFSKIRQQFKDVLLILVPRHRERFSEVAELIKQQGFSFVTRSSGQYPEVNTDVFLGDTMGELLLFYAASEIAFVGGSLVSVGGHNTLEPAALGVPCLVGPYVHNFTEITHKLKSAGALQQIEDVDSLAVAVCDWLRHPEKRTQAGQQGKTAVAENRGAIQKLLKLLSSYFNNA